MALDLLLEQFDGLIQTPADVKKLEQTILQWAVMGRLAPQDANDEPASVLLKRIAAERARLVKEKKIKRAKKWPPISDDEIPYPVPSSWKWVRLPEIYYSHGQTKPDRLFTYIDVSAINKEDGVIGNELQIVKPENAPSRARKLVANGSILYSTVRPYLLNIAIVDGEISPKPIVSTAFAVMQPFTGVFNRFLYFYLRSKPFIEFVESQMTGVAYPAISDSKLNLGLVPLPPTEEQKRIVARVDELFEQTRTLAAQLEAAQEARTRLHRAAVGQFVAAISKSRPLEPALAPSCPESQDIQALLMAQFDRLHTQQADVDALKQTILQLAVMGRLVAQDPNDEPASVLLKRIAAEKARLVKEKKIKRPKKLPPISDEEMPRIPQNWKWTYLNNLLVGIKAGKSPQAQKRPAENGEVGVLKVSAVTWGTFNPIENKALLPGTDVTNWPTVQASDLLISRANTAELVGTVVLVEEDYPNLVLSDKTLRLDFVHDSIFKPFMLFALRARWVRDMFEGGAIGTSSSMRNISQSKIRAAKIALPPLKEQKRIVAKVDELFALCDQLAAGLESAEAMRERFLDAVLAQAVRG